MRKKFLSNADRPLKGVGKEAKTLLAWLETHYELESARPLVAQMLQTVQRLQQVRTQIRKSGLVIDGKPNALLGVEHKLAEQFLKCWRTLGLADAPQEERRPVGRPPQGEERWRA